MVKAKLKVVEENDNTQDLMKYIARVEALREDRAAINEDIKNVFGEAALSGYDAKIMRKLVAIRAMDQEKRLEDKRKLDEYMEAIGMDE